MNDENNFLPGLLDPSDGADYVAVHNIIRQRGLSATLDLIAEFCERRIAYAIRNNSQANKNAWQARYEAIRLAALSIDRHRKL